MKHPTNLFFLLIAIGFCACNSSSNNDDKKITDTATNNAVAVFENKTATPNEISEVPKVDTAKQESPEFNAKKEVKTIDKKISKADTAKKENPYRNAKIEVKTINNEVSTQEKLTGWGYDIYIFGSLYIHQPNIPAVPGNRGFKTEADAKKAGAWAVHKIRNNIMPPTISVEELDSLGVLK